MEGKNWSICCHSGIMKGKWDVKININKTIIKYTFTGYYHYYNFTYPLNSGRKYRSSCHKSGIEKGKIHRMLIFVTQSTLIYLTGPL